MLQVELISFYCTTFYNTVDFKRKATSTNFDKVSRVQNVPFLSLITTSGLDITTLVTPLVCSSYDG